MTVLPVHAEPHPPNTSAQRTHLAWTRTTLSIAACGIALTRLLWERSPVVGAAVMVVSVCLGAVLVVLDRVRSPDGTARVHDGLVLAVVAVGTCALGCAALALVALR